MESVRPPWFDHAACYRAIATRDARFDGRLFTAVRSTGIYCRPICPARTPRPENVIFYPTAAAAQAAGFRSCLRCRPESSPDFAVWRGTSNTVTRALALIADGALDEDAVEALGDHLGVGARQLRRLFRQHLGASPVAVAQTRRVLFAKQLIGETDLPLGEVALAAGFGSVRRFNATFRPLYARSPRALRRECKEGTTIPAATGLAITLPYAPPYDWAAMIAFLRSRAIPGVECVDAAGRYHRVVALGTTHGTITVEHDARNGAVRARIRFPDVTALATIVARIRRIFDLGADPIAIAGHLATDPLLSPRISARPGLRVPGAWDGFELAIRAVLGQQITVAAATRLAGKLVAAYGAPLDIAAPDGLNHVFPRPERLIDADLRHLGMPGARARTLSNLAAAAVADPQLFAPGQSLEGAIARLREIPGIGDWTAQYIAMRALRQPDAFPAADIGLMRALAGPDGRRPTATQLAAQAEGWRPWRAYAALHLWTSESAPDLTGEHADVPA
jgi:AraC family transcriptional regulator of adaptative response / DNA-3-methyladenine glycosylase II